ncbi:MAG: putative outer membrane protein Omp85, partial [Chlamydiota bacterium]
MFHRFTTRSLLFFIAVAIELAAGEFYEDKKVAKVEIVVVSQGDTDVDPRVYMAKMRTKEGDTFSQLIFDNDLKTLAAEFDRVEPTVSLKDNSIAITIYVTPRPYIHRITWEGNERYKSSTLQSELDVQPNQVFNRAEFNKAFNKVKEFYFKKGYFEAQLSYNIIPIPGTNKVDIDIHIVEGRSGHIKKIVLEGFTSDEKSAIEEQMYLKKYNFLLSWLTGQGIYRDELLEQDRMTILNLLHNKGYADAKVDIQLQDDPDTGKLIVHIEAHRGQLFHFGSVSFCGGELFTKEELMQRSQAVEGGTYSPDKVRDTAQAIKELYGQKGYIDASVQYEMRLSEYDPVFD